MTRNVSTDKLDHHERQDTWLWILLLVLWAGGLLRPELAYPFHGLASAIAIAVVCVVAPLILSVRLTSLFPRGLIVTFGFLGGYLGWVALRWAIDGFPAVGADSFATQWEWGAYLFASFCLTAALGKDTPHAVGGSETRSPVWGLFALTSVLALGFGLHAIAQYAYLYDRQLEGLLRELRGRAPSPLEMGLIHHLRIKRVASVWGDPNALGCFLAVGFVAATVLWRARPPALFSKAHCRVVAVLTAVVCLVGIYLTASRGAMLDVLLVGALLSYFARRTGRLSSGLVAGVVVAGLLATSPGRAQVPMQSPAGQHSWWKRSDTIRERIHYARIGLAMVQMHPALGNGLGSVALHYGRLKPAEARESKYLHNWILQTAAELGLVGLLLYVGFWGSAFVALGASSAPPPAERQALIAVCAAFLFDGLIQLSFNQRELMHTFGMFSGTLLGNAVVGSHSESRKGMRIVLHALKGWGVVLVVGLCAGVGLPLFASTQRLAADNALATNDFTLAEARLHSALSATPKDPWLWDSLAYVYERQGRLRDARNALAKALLLQPTSARLHDRVAQILERMGELAEAERYVRKALELYPTQADYYRHLSTLLEKRGDVAGALEAARQAARYNYLKPEEDAKRVELLEQRVRAGHHEEQ